jgi:hypothetical protein
METELKNQGTFQEHYGRFPYIVHRMFSGIYRQIPIVCYEVYGAELVCLFSLLVYLHVANAKYHSNMLAYSLPVKFPFLYPFDRLQNCQLPMNFSYQYPRSWI